MSIEILYEILPSADILIFIQIICRLSHQNHDNLSKLFLKLILMMNPRIMHQSSHLTQLKHMFLDKRRFVARVASTRPSLGILLEIMYVHHLFKNKRSCTKLY